MIHLKYSVFNMSQVEVGCPWVRGLQPQSHPTAEEHPQAYQSATQQQVPPPNPCAQHPTIAPITLVEVKWKKPKRGGGGETLNQESGGKEGNQEKCYTTRRPRHTNTASSTRQTQRRHMAGTCAEVTYCWTESAPMLTNNGKCYKANIVMRQPYRQSTSHQRTPKTLKTIAPSR